MKVTKILRDNLADFFKHDFLIKRIESETIKDEILVVVRFTDLESDVYVVTNNDFDIRYIL